MKEGYTHVAFLLDRSGSMDDIKGDTIGGFNSFLKDQKKDDTKCTFSMVQFDHEYNVIHDFDDIKKIKNLTGKSYVPRGTTALLDALGMLITTTGEKLDDMDENDRPEKVLFIILTDGLENSSKEYTHTQITEMLKHQEEKYNWKFIYLGANQDAFKESSKLGISSINTMNVSHNSKGHAAAYATASSVVTRTRGVDVNSYATMDTITDEDIKKQEEAGKSN